MQQFTYGMFLLVCLPILANAQTIQDNFEGNGTITSWFGDDCTINTKAANTYKTGINTSATVLSYTDNGGQYANVRFDVGNNFDLSTNYLFSIKIYVPSSGLSGTQPRQISLKLQDGKLGQPWATQSEVIKPIVLDQWQTVTFNFKNDAYVNLDPGSLPPTQRKDFNRVVLQVNGENNNSKVLAYLDDLYYDGAVALDPVYDKLVWSDEFDVNGAIDSSKWFHQTQLPNGGSWYNNEIQHYTNRVANSFVENGQLKIVAKKEAFTAQGVTKQYTSARLNSKFAFKYGKVEIRAKLPSGVGTWPALWMLGKNINEDGAYWDQKGFGTTGWPACGEIDIMEHWGSNQNYVQSAIHTPSSFGGTVNVGGQLIPTVSSAFHIYTFVWTPQKLVFSVDNVPHYTYSPDVKDAKTWPFDAAQYLLLNFAIQQSIAPSFASGSMDIDYVRVYQESTSATTPSVLESAMIFYPNPVRDELTIALEPTDQRDVIISISTIEGNLVQTGSYSIQKDKVNIGNLASLPNGLYLLSFEQNGRIHGLKFLKN